MILWTAPILYFKTGKYELFICVLHSVTVERIKLLSISIKGIKFVNKKLLTKKSPIQD